MGMCADAFQGVYVRAVRHGSDLNKIIICLMLMNQKTETDCSAPQHFLTTT